MTAKRELGECEIICKNKKGFDFDFEIGLQAIENSEEEKNKKI